MPCCVLQVIKVIKALASDDSVPSFSFQNHWIAIQQQAASLLTRQGGEMIQRPGGEMSYVSPLLWAEARFR